MNEDDSVALDVQENDRRLIGRMDNDRQARIGEFMRELDVAGTISSNNTTSIYRIPKCIRELNPALYEPQILSLGPYHHGKLQFQAMDKLKRCYFKSFLRRNQNLNVEDYYELVENNENEARSAYSEQELPVNFVEMMLLDCCFVLEFLLISSGNWMQGGGEEREIMNPIHISAWATPFVMRDMLLLENQLPFFLLEELLELNIPDQNITFTKIVLDMFWDLMPGKIQKNLTGREGATVIHIHHILHLMYSRIIPMVQEDHPETVNGDASQEQTVQTSMLEDHPNSCWFKMFKHGAKLVQSQVQSCCLSSSAVDGVASQEHPRASLSCCFKMFQHGPVQSSRPSGDPIDDDASQEPTVCWIPCAKRLSEAGVVFKKKTNYRTFLDVTFDRGTMEIPPLQIFGSISSIFSNLIAFEQCYTPNSGPFYLSSYASLMNFVIDTTADVELLEQEGIIVSTLGSDKDVAILFNQLGKHAAIDNNNHLASVFDAIKNHCDKKMNRWKAILNHKYLGNPWAVISVVGAISLLVLTFVQTVGTFLT